MAGWLRLLIVAWLAIGSAFGFSDGADSVAVGALPAEARTTLALIRQGGPFPHERDGIEFRNFERRLPRAGRGYYHEYTVRTPGERGRGARRIITGGQPPAVYYYTDDHYQSFRRIRE